MRPQNVAVVGATGAVGHEMLRVLAQRAFPLASLRLIASPASAGKKVTFDGAEHTLVAPSREAFSGLDLALFSAGASVAREWGPVAAGLGALVVDNSSAFRQDPEIPLVVPEVNARALENNPRRIVANPNCSTIQMVVALAPLHRAFGLEQVVVSTYQAISGKGARALDEFDAQARDLAAGREATHSVLPGVLAQNLLCDWKHDADGWSEEERKMVFETRKILGMPSLAVSPTTVRVPVRNAHSESVWARFAKPVTRAEALEVLRGAEGVTVQSESGPGAHPQPRFASGKDDVFVGRVREDASDKRALHLWVVSDNVRKGAALNAVQIAERVLR
ncbi:MAG: aspartate-semialdehyde dehydrogenase [Myxococcales bacterium]|nr:aspartate-semialdehyde dehydrogenase [Myxococcales bacterium]